MLLYLDGHRENSRREWQRRWNDIEDVKDHRNLGEGVSRYYNYEYKILNAALRKGGAMSPVDKRTFDGMKKAMEPVSKDYLVFRGWRNNPKFARMEIGKVVTSPQFTSTTVDPHYAVQWSSHNSSTGEVYRTNPIWQIRVPKGAKGLMAHDFEIELTLDTSTKFRCVGIRKGTVVSNGRLGIEYYAQDIYDMEVVLDE